MSVVGSKNLVGESPLEYNGYLLRILALLISMEDDSVNLVGGYDVGLYGGSVMIICYISTSVHVSNTFLHFLFL